MFIALPKHVAQEAPLELSKWQFVLHGVPINRTKAKEIWQKLHWMCFFLPLAVGGGSGPPSNTTFFGPPKVFTPNGIWIRSAAFAHHSRVSE